MSEEKHQPDATNLRGLLVAHDANDPMSRALARESAAIAENTRLRAEFGDLEARIEALERAVYILQNQDEGR